MPDVQINNLRVRLRGVSPGTAQAAIAQLQGALHAAMQGTAVQGTSARHLDLGTLRTTALPSAEGIAGALAGRIVGQISAPQPRTLT